MPNHSNISVNYPNSEIFIVLHLSMALFESTNDLHASPECSV